MVSVKKPLGSVAEASTADVRDFWNSGSCGEVYATGTSERERFDSQHRMRYILEPYIIDFARFHEAPGKDVLEIGVGMGADHLEWAKAGPKSLTGVDLTPRAVEWTRRRLELYGFKPNVEVADAQKLPFADNSFDLVYSWGVLHCAPDTPATIDQVYRILRPGGTARIMVYHRHSLVGYMLWLRYGLLAGKPGRSLDYIYTHYLESPGTKAYSVEDARKLCARFSSVKTGIVLSIGDTLEGEAGQQHHGPMLSFARKIWPRWFVRRFMPNHGLFLMIEATK